MKFETKQMNYFAGMIQIPMPASEIQKAQRLQEACNNGKTLVVEVKVKSKKRSLSANAYCWVLCDMIAKVIRSTKEEVYKKAIREVGVFDVFTIPYAAVKASVDRWQRNGVGWVAEYIGASKNVPGYSDVAYYYGSSTYNSSEMKSLLDWLYDEAYALGCDVLSEADKALLMDDMEERERNAT